MTLTSPHHYEIRVAGTLPPEALLDFEQLNASIEPVGTMVHGVLPDQAALYGLLTRLEALGAQVLEVRRLHDPPGTADRSAGQLRTDAQQPDRAPPGEAV
ncbi:MAG TPA: hypothetical protein VKD66_09005 [Streptosporangiaceae bacterium]|nr:hypothetical protein [Streptosporangiaceae bacterium]